ncbi:MAG: glutathione peroxidase [Bacteriovoracaceae bacterium]
MRLWIILSLLFSNMAFAAANFYDLKGTSIEGKPVNFKDYKGKVLMVVNIASQCGYTPQLADLEALNLKYKGQNFVIIGFPSNEFGGQTPETDAEMKAFCSRTYSVTFPLMKKAEVIGSKRQDVYRFFADLPEKNMKEDVKWNFEKFIISKDGKVVDRYSSKVKPLDESITKKIDSLL